MKQQLHVWYNIWIVGAARIRLPVNIEYSAVRTMYWFLAGKRLGE